MIRGSVAELWLFSHFNRWGFQFSQFFYMSSIPKLLLKKYLPLLFPFWGFTCLRGPFKKQLVKNHAQMHTPPWKLSQRTKKRPKKVFWPFWMCHQGDSVVSWSKLVHRALFSILHSIPVTPKKWKVSFSKLFKMTICT